MKGPMRENHIIVKKLTVAGQEVTGGIVLAADQSVDLNGIADALVLDADTDTTISAPTDDQIDIEVAGADDFRFTANTFTALSGSSIATDVIAETTGAAGVTIDGALVKDGTVPTRQTVTLAAADGAVTAKDGLVVITKATAAALTIADPTAVTDDGKVLKIISRTAAAHTLDNSAGSGFNAGGAGSDVGTFGGAIGDGLELVADNGKWLVAYLRNVTLA